jgi:hypothetical protein
VILSSRDPIAAAKASKRLVQAGEWQRLPGRDDQTKILLAIKSKIPWALGQVPVDGLLALTKQPPPGGCSWCSQVVVRTPKPELERTEANLALLGGGCTSCRVRWEAAAVAAREAAHIDQLVAAGFRPQAAANLRTPEQVAAYTRSLRALENAKPPPRPSRSRSTAGTSTSRGAVQTADRDRCPCGRCQVRRGR